MIHRICPQCEQPFVEQLWSYAIGAVCPPCLRAYNVADFVANSPAFSQEIQQEVEEFKASVWNLGMVVLGLAAAVAIFDKPRTRRRR